MTPAWAEVVTAVFAVVGAVAALLGSFGVLRLGSFFQRVHAPTLASTVGTWGLTTATITQASFVAGQPFVHALLVALFIAVTAPVTTVLLMRAAVFRARVRRDPDAPARLDGANEVG